MKILIIGANGQLGSDIVRVLDSRQVIPLTHKDIEIADKDCVQKIITSYNPDIVINTAAYHNVKECEKDDIKSFKVNALGAKNLATICKKRDIILVHISTDYVFDGKKRKPYIESDSPCPLNVYGLTKLAGEYYIRYIWPKHFIIRTSGLYGLSKCRAKGGNFIDLMLKLAKEKDEIQVVGDEILTPTYTLDLAQKIKDVIKTEYFGLYHITNNGFCSWYEFAREIFKFSGLKVNLKRTTVKEFGGEVKRPPYSVLKNHNLEKLGMDDMRDWKEALKDFLSVRLRRANR